MPRNVPANLQTQADARDTFWATCAKIKRKDGQLFTFTDHNRSISINVDTDGEQVYEPGASIVKRTSITESLGMRVGNSDIDAVFDSDSITEADLIAGLFDDAEVKMFFVNWQDVSDGIIKLRRGNLGIVTRKDFTFNAELRSLLQWLQNSVGPLYSLRCRSDFGDLDSGTQAGCGLMLSPDTWQAATSYDVAIDRDGKPQFVHPTVENGYMYEPLNSGTSGGSEPTWPVVLGDTVVDNDITWTTKRSLERSASVLSSSSRKQFFVGGILGDLTAGKGGTQNGNYYDLGTIEITSGDNAGLIREIVSFGDLDTSPVGYEITTFLPFPFDIVGGETCLLHPGCNKMLNVCRDSYENVFNYRGEGFIPGSDELFVINRSPESSGKK